MKVFAKLKFREEQADLLEVATAFCRDKSPIEKVRSLIETEIGYDPAVWQEMADLGWLGIAIPEAQGGVGLSLAELVPVIEQTGRRLMATPLIQTSLSAETLLTGGTEAQKAQFLPKLASGAIATLALTDPEGGWDLNKPTALATRSTNGIELSGTKILVEYADTASMILISASLEGRPALLVLETSPDLKARLKRDLIIDETRRAYRLDLTGLIVSEDQLMDASQTAATLERLHLTANLLGAAEMVGGTQAVIDYTLDYLKTRKQFGRLIGSYQALKHPMVDAYTAYEAARSHLYAAASAISDPQTGETAVRMAKATADKAFSYASDRAIQFHGGFGFTYDCDAQLYRRRAIWHASQWGDAAFHRRKLADLLLS